VASSLIFDELTEIVAFELPNVSPATRVKFNGQDVEGWGETHRRDVMHRKCSKVRELRVTSCIGSTARVTSWIFDDRGVQY
jgi:hypothetical protein